METKSDTKKIIEVNKVSKFFPGVKALEKVDFELRQGEIHAIVGENGAGKSTLIKIITGVLKPTEGKIYYSNNEVNWKSSIESQIQGISAIYQEPTLFPDLNVAENIFIVHQKTNRFSRKISWQFCYKETKRLLEILGVNELISPKDLVEGLSIAERQIVEIAKALSFNSKVIIMDEPTSSLSLKESDNLFKIIKKLKDRGTSIILISHKPEDIFNIAERVSVYRDGRYVGTKNVNEINKDELINMMVGRKIETLFPKIKVNIGQELLRVEKLSKKGKFRDISFTLHKGEILGMAGLVGAGRTEVAEAIFGVEFPDKGRLFIEGKERIIKTPFDAMNLGLGFITENRSFNGLILDMDIAENITINILRKLSKKLLVNRREVDKLSEKQVNKLDIKTTGIRQKVKNLSGGNQQKVAIAKWLNSSPKILIMDEPTKGIDVATKAAIHQIMSELAKDGMGILMISSELPEVLGMSDNIIVMHEGIITGIYKKEESNQEIIMAAAVSNKEFKYS